MSTPKKRFIVRVIIPCISFLILWRFVFWGSTLEGEKSHDFGLVEVTRPTTALEHTFVLTNRSGKELVLVDVIPDCGCTTTEAYQEVIGNGEALILPVRFTLRQSQIRKSTIRLVFENGSIELLRLQAEGRMKQPLRISPVPINLTPEGESVFGILGMEWFEEGEPPMPKFTVPDVVTLQHETWKLKSKMKAWEKIPANWSMKFELATDHTLPDGSEIKIVVKGNELVAPLLSEVLPQGATPFSRIPVQ